MAGTTARRARAEAPSGARSRHRRGRVASGETEGVLYDSVVIVPARNEEVGVLTSLQSLAAQSRRPDLIIVVVNNSTDRTEDFARQFADDERTPPTVVLTLDNNPHKKAGALNYGLNWLREAVGGRLTDRVRHVLVMDADTELHVKFIERARNVIASDPELGGVSAACLGRTDLWRNPWQRYLLGMQIIEYGRAANTRYRSDVHTMSGAGSFYRGEALQGLIDWRGEVFWEDHRNLVEDYETTLTLKESGWKVTANQLCIAYTDLMPTLRELIQQRERWSRGTVDTLRSRGFTKFTWHSITTMIMGLFGAAYILGWGSTRLVSAAQHGFSNSPFMWALFSFWIIYPALRVRNLGWKAMIVEAILLPELVYTVVRTYWLVASIVKSYVTRVSAWK
ncbi:cellulose synthase/poly-beta-1,6-N-acetylglucosamine synthase-like glycosyltransferase [Kitasatospora sp. MAA4]|uniref:glycosyltransferase family 2 protein n=1 Tax=Kitasatospora sp. MAA4 TaxID=3035093 RepID=UPI0024760D70|nr:glycosyltransferase family 2 protein [Kitasatospora sp. MAA4]MDH6137852.1 cellulose synthase/poly-beta-1,6-N-acetylglucosamine synthase-like glycosyltransferase [Kitasatospora sp. MAA4]